MHAPGRALAVVALTVVAGACGGGQQAVDGPDWLTGPSRPVMLETTSDDANAMTRVITPRGGTLIATGADGTRYRLRIPEGALLSPVSITMTPIGLVDGLPVSGSSTVAVQLEPSGLQLYRPAELAIMPPGDVPVAEQVAFAWYGSGQDAHRYPLRLDAHRIEMDLLHFSGYGFTRAPPGDPGRVALQQAASHEARLIARIAEATDADRSAGLEHVSDQTQQLFQQSMVEYYDAILRPLMERGEADHRLAECCGMRWAQWERQIQLLLVDDQGRTSSPELETRRAQAKASYERILQNQFEQGMDRAIRLCREDHDFSAVQVMFGLLRGAELLGVPTNGRGEQVQEEIERCLSFEVEFRSSFDNRAPASTRMYYEVAADLPVQVNIFVRENTAFATAPLEYIRYESEGNPKEAVWGRDGGDERTAWFDALTSVRMSPNGTRGSTFTVHAIEWDLNTIQKPGTDCAGKDVMQAGDTVVDFSITFSPGIPVEITRGEPVNRAVAPFDIENTSWAWHWSQSHGDARTVVRGVRVEDDELGGPFRMTLERTEPGTWSWIFDEDHGTELGFSLEEGGHIIVRHAPK